MPGMWFKRFPLSEGKKKIKRKKNHKYLHLKYLRYEKKKSKNPPQK